MSCNPQSEAERFWSKVRPEPGDGCWLWVGTMHHKGYGQFSIGKSRSVRAHRWSWEYHYGLIPPGMLVCHRCDVPKCVNPAHLFLGTHSDNAQDKMRKGRAPCGEGHYAAKLTSAAVTEIRQRYAAGGISQSDLAKEYGVSETSVWVIVRGKRWQSVEQRARVAQSKQDPLG